MSPKIYTKFLADLEGGAFPIYVSIYHAVRNIPYGVTGERSAIAVLDKRIGSCSGKHLLLRDLLQIAGYDAQIITIHTHFNKQIPLVPSFSDDLAQMIRVGEITDYHHYVRALIDGKWLKLDATWPDALGAYGFAVNTAWNGIGDTIIAAATIEEFPAVEDLVKFKSDMIAALPQEIQDKRQQFFEKITDWMQTHLPADSTAKVE